MSYQDDGAGGDFGWSSQWANSAKTQLGAVPYKSRRSWRDFNDDMILSGMRVEGNSPDNPGMLRVSYHPGVGFEACVADVEDWDNPSARINFCHFVRGHIQDQTKGKTNHNRDGLSERNKQAIEAGAPADQWSTDPMTALLGPNGQPIPPVPGPTHVPAPSAVSGTADPVAAMQQQLTQTYHQLSDQRNQYQAAINQLDVQLATIEAQLAAFNAAAAAVAPPAPVALTPPAPIVPAPPAPAPVVPTPATTVPTVAPAPVANSVKEPISESYPEEEEAADAGPPPGLPVVDDSPAGPPAGVATSAIKLPDGV